MFVEDRGEAIGEVLSAPAAADPRPDGQKVKACIDAEPVSVW